jgi:hypothetical protein
LTIEITHYQSLTIDKWHFSERFLTGSGRSRSRPAGRLMSKQWHFGSGNTQRRFKITIINLDHGDQGAGMAGPSQVLTHRSESRGAISQQPIIFLKLIENTTITR